MYVCVYRCVMCVYMYVYVCMCMYIYAYMCGGVCCVCIYVCIYIYSLLSVRLELPVADSIKQHHVYSVRTIKIFPYEII